jgi:hypothetical protein
VALKSSFGKGTDPSTEVTCVAKSAVDKKYWRPGHRLRSHPRLLMLGQYGHARLLICLGMVDDLVALGKREPGAA